MGPDSARSLYYVMKKGDLSLMDYAPVSDAQISTGSLRWDLNRPLSLHQRPFDEQTPTVSLFRVGCRPSLLTKAAIRQRTP